LSEQLGTKPIYYNRKGVSIKFLRPCLVKVLDIYYKTGSKAPDEDEDEDEDEEEEEEEEEGGRGESAANKKGACLKSLQQFKCWAQSTMLPIVPKAGWSHRGILSSRSILRLGPRTRHPSSLSGNHYTREAIAILSLPTCIGMH
jgi:hypothetical protein